LSVDTAGSVSGTAFPALRRRHHYPHSVVQECIRIDVFCDVNGTAIAIRGGIRSSSSILIVSAVVLASVLAALGNQRQNHKVENTRRSRRFPFLHCFSG
jgi:hypothetical protein